MERAPIIVSEKASGVYAIYEEANSNHLAVTQYGIPIHRTIVQRAVWLEGLEQRKLRPH